MSDRENHLPPPKTVDLIYRKVGDTHIFASKGITGLVHVGHSDLEEAYETTIRALSVHVSLTYGTEAKYVCTTSLDQLKARVEGNHRLFSVTLDQQQGACH